MIKEYHRTKDLNTNRAVRLVERAEKFMRIVGDCRGRNGGEFVENTGIIPHFDETGNTNLC